MPIYPYSCECGENFDIVKSVAELDKSEVCGCGKTARRLIAASAVDKTSCAQPYFEPALGCIIKSKGHKQRILKQKGLEEVGNTSAETLYKDYTKATQERIAKSWEAL